MTVATMYGHKHTHTGPSRMRNMGRGDWYAGRKCSPPAKKTKQWERIELRSSSKQKIKHNVFGSHQGTAWVAANVPNDQSHRWSQTLGDKEFFFRHVTLVTIWSFSQPHLRRVFRAGNRCSMLMNSPERASAPTFNGKKATKMQHSKVKKLKITKHCPQCTLYKKDCRPEQWRCRRRAMLSNGLSSGCTNNVPTYAKICADDTDDSRH